MPNRGLGPDHQAFIAEAEARLHDFFRTLKLEGFQLLMRIRYFPYAVKVAKVFAEDTIYPDKNDSSHYLCPMVGDFELNVLKPGLKGEKERRAIVKMHFALAGLHRIGLSVWWKIRSREVFYKHLKDMHESYGSDYPEDARVHVPFNDLEL